MYLKKNKEWVNKENNGLVLWMKQDRSSLCHRKRSVVSKVRKEEEAGEAKEDMKT